LRGQVVSLAREDSGISADLAVDARRLMGRIADESEALEGALRPYAAFMREHAIAAPNLAGQSLQSLRNMAAYAEQRSARLVQAAHTLETQLTQASDATRDTIRQAALLAASSKFVDDCRARISKVWRTPAKSSALQLPYFADIYGEYLAFLQMEPFCRSTTTVPWAATGCNLLATEFSKVQQVLDRTLPFTIRVNVLTMRKAGIEEALLLPIENALAAGNLGVAVSLYDLAVRASDAEAGGQR
jgi:hypothetical protein